MGQCEWPEGFTVNVGGLADVEPCLFEDIEMHTNVTVIVSRCKVCGRVELSWIRQEDTEDVEI